MADATNHVMPQVGSSLAGFRLEEILARGGMGVVYRALQLSLERQVALKIIAPELLGYEPLRERLLQEAKVAAGIEHPHVLPVYEAGEQEGVVFIAMRLVQGESLAELLAREGRLPPERAIRLVSQAAGGRQAAHEAGLVHRDVKPGNLLLATVAGKEHVFVCDFGLARSVLAAGVSSQEGFAGTVRYAAPSRYAGIRSTRAPTSTPLPASSISA